MREPPAYGGTLMSPLCGRGTESTVSTLTSPELERNVNPPKPAISQAADTGYTSGKLAKTIQATPCGSTKFQAGIRSPHADSCPHTVFHGGAVRDDVSLEIRSIDVPQIGQAMMATFASLVSVITKSSG
jgi:hypothetical protein